MARIKLLDGPQSESFRVWHWHPVYEDLRIKIREAVNADTCLSVREHEAARMRIALINGCEVCRKHSVHGVDRDFYDHVTDWATWPGYSERERLAIEFAERFAIAHEDIDDELFKRLGEWYSETDIVALGFLVATYLGFGRLTAVLKAYGDACEL